MSTRRILLAAALGAAVLVFLAGIFDDPDTDDDDDGDWALDVEDLLAKSSSTGYRVSP